MAGTSNAVDDFESGLDALERQYQGLVHQLRMERLGRQLDRGPMLAVRDSRCGFCGDRLMLWLDNGAVMKLKLLWPKRVMWSAVSSVAWRDEIGWVVGGRTTAGDDVICYSWQVSLTGFSAVG